MEKKHMVSPLGRDLEMVETLHIFWGSLQAVIIPLNTINNH